MFNLENLLGNEYFPKELPPCFTTKMLGENKNLIKGLVESSNTKCSIPYTYSGFKNENSRRKFAIPNPYHYTKAAICLVENNKEISAILDSSKMSLSKPIKGEVMDGMPYAKQTYSFLDTRKEIEKLYQNNKYQIKLDISSFFESIYTHSIPWAIHGIKKSKESKGKGNLTGDKIDKTMQAMNYAQTSGILVGNAISRIVSEIILCKIDDSIQNKFPEIIARRFVDDYYIFVKNSYEIQKIIAHINRELSKFELRLNENKISITESPFVFEKPWVEELKLYIHLDKKLFWDKMVYIFNKNKDISILKYGLKVISLHSFSKEDWPVIESKVLNLWNGYPSLAELILDILVTNKDKLKINNVKNTIYSILDNTIQLNYHQEIIWVVWVSKLLNINLKTEYIEAIIESKNIPAIIIILDEISNQKWKKTKGISKSINEIRDVIEEDIEDIKDNMFSQFWLLIYEAEFNNWDIEFSKNYSDESDFFRKMKKNQISFYNKDYEYNQKASNNKAINKYITRKEFEEYRKMMKHLIEKTTSDEKINFEIQEENERISEKIEILLGKYF